MWRVAASLARTPRRLGALGVAIGAALAPALARAQFFDPDPMMDQAAYSLWSGILLALWQANQALLGLAYTLDQMRVWIVDTAFRSAFQAMVQAVIDPLVAPVAVIALIAFGLSFLLLPLLGQGAIIGNVRQIVTLAMAAPVLLASAGPLLADIEKARRDVGVQLAAAAGAVLPGDIFGVRPSDRQMATPVPLYTSQRFICGTVMVRPGAEGAMRDSPPLRMDDLAAALAWATAEDIHCPAPGVAYPQAFAIAPPEGPGYINESGNISSLPDSDRNGQIERTQLGVNRLALGIVPSALGALEAFLQLVFSLALTALWMMLPFTLLLMFFQKDAGPLMRLIGQAFDVVRSSWGASLLLGLVFVCVAGAAQTGNAAAYIGASIGGVLLSASMLSSAVGTLLQSFASFNSLVGAGGALGRALEPPGKLARGGLHAAGGAAGGAARAGVAYGAALRATRSRRYAGAAALGTMRPIARIGEVARSMGWLEDEELYSGLKAGERMRAREGLGSFNRRVRADAARPVGGKTPGVRARERAALRALTRMEAPALLDRAGAMAAGVAARAGNAVRSISGGGHSRDAAAQDAAAAPGTPWQEVGRAAQAPGEAATASKRTPAAGDPGGGEVTGPARGAGSAGAAVAPGAHAGRRRVGDELRARRAPDLSRAAIRQGADPRAMERVERIDAASPPAGVEVHQRHASDLTLRERAALLAQGYALQVEPDGWLTYWRPAQAGDGERLPGVEAPEGPTSRGRPRRSAGGSARRTRGAGDYGPDDEE